MAVARALGFPWSSRRRRPVHTRRRREASRSISRTKRRFGPRRADRTPVVVQPMISGGTELLAGLVQDPVFGPLVAFGPGGVLAELIGEASFRIAPLTDVDAEELVTGRQGRPSRSWVPRRPASDVAALVDLVQRLSRLGLDMPEVAELDLNPVLGLQTAAWPSTRACAFGDPQIVDAAQDVVRSARLSASSSLHATRTSPRITRLERRVGPCKS